jgi:putative endopeptidase
VTGEAARLTRREALGAALAGVALSATPPSWAQTPMGLDISAMDLTVRPGADFFRYANGAWFDRYVLRDDEVYAGSRTRLSDLRRERIRNLIEDAARSLPDLDTIAGQIGALFVSWTDPRAAKGLQAVALERARIDAIESHADLVEIFGGSPASGLASPFEASLFFDFHEPYRMRYALAPGGLGLTTREYYLDEVHSGTREAYVAYVGDILRRAGVDDPASAAASVLALETDMARQFWPTVDAYDFVKTANNRSPEDLISLAPGFDWRAFLTAAGGGDLDVLIIKQPSAMAPLVGVVQATPLAVWKSWLTFHLVSDNADYLGEPFETARFAFYGARLQGQTSPRPRWSRGVDLVESFLGMQVGQLYVERYSLAEAKARTTVMFANIRAVMRDQIQAAAWMSESTRAEALRKIDTLNVKIAYPDHWPERPGYSFKPDDLYENVRDGRAIRWRRRMDSARRPVGRDEWGTTPQNTSAAANPSFNEITVPAGVLAPPFFNLAADDAVNYGAIGGVIGHELNHMFDQIGRRLDADGRLRDWWAEADGAKYEAVAARVERQYSEFEPLPGRFINGRQTLNENIADISGLGVAFLAWRRSLGGQSAPAMAGFSGEQRVFLGWAQMRAAKEREAFLAGQLATGVHSPDRYRIDGVVRNIDAWYEAFDVQPSDALYLAPDERAKFW